MMALSDINPDAFARGQTQAARAISAAFRAGLATPWMGRFYLDRQRL